MKEFTLKVTDKDIALIAQALGDLPFKMVVNLVAKLDDQIKEQLKAKENTDATTSAGAN